jgi:PHS family inorganic phosphate transporter-like MFS transporter
MDHNLLGEPAATFPRTYGGNAAFHNFHNDYSHIQDPNLRRRLALSEVRAPFLTDNISFNRTERN